MTTEREAPLDEPQNDAEELLMLAGILLADGPMNREKAAQMLVRVAKRVETCEEEHAWLAAIIDDLRRLACDACSNDEPRDAQGRHHGRHQEVDCAAWTDTEAAEAAKEKP